SVVRTAQRNADSCALCRQSSCDARALRASFCEDESQWVTSCDSQPTPATKLLVSQHGSGRGACGFVLTGDPELESNFLSDSQLGTTLPVFTERVSHCNYDLNLWISKTQ